MIENINNFILSTKETFNYHNYTGAAMRATAVVVSGIAISAMITYLGPLAIICGSVACEIGGFFFARSFLNEGFNGTSMMKATASVAAGLVASALVTYLGPLAITLCSSGCQMGSYAFAGYLLTYTYETSITETCEKLARIFFRVAERTRENTHNWMQVNSPASLDFLLRCTRTCQQAFNQ